MYLWQDHGIFGVFDPEDGWCRPDADGAEPGGVRGVVCDVIPDGEDMVAWFGVGWIVVLLTGFYLWYWPGVRRWATAFVIRRGRGRSRSTCRCTRPSASWCGCRSSRSPSPAWRSRSRR